MKVKEVEKHLKPCQTIKKFVNEFAALKTAPQSVKDSGEIKTTYITAQLRSVRILRRILEAGGNLLSLSLQWKPFI